MGWAWFFVNIVLPAVFPVMGVFLLRITTNPHQITNKNKYRLMNVLKDGQLGWIAAGMASSSLYDFIDMFDIYNNHSGQKTKIGWFILLIPIFFSLLIGVLSGAQGAVNGSAKSSEPLSSWSTWFDHYQTFIVSVVIMLIASATWTLIHFTMMPTPLTYNFGG